MDASLPIIFSELPPLAGVGVLWVGAIGALGAMLVARGAKLLPLLALLAGAVGGWALGIRLHQMQLLRVPDWALASVCSVVLAILSTVFLRLGIAWITALVVSALCLIATCGMLDRGMLDLAPVPIVRGGADLTDGSADPILTAQPSVPSDLTRTLLGAIAQSFKDVPSDLSFLPRLGAAWRHMHERLNGWWVRLPSNAQTLMSAAGWGGFVVGLGIGLFFRVVVHVVITSVIGSALAVASISSLAERMSGGRWALPDELLPWVLFIAAGTVLGVLLQSPSRIRAPEQVDAEEEPDRG